MEELEQLPFDLDFPEPAPRSPDLRNLRARGERRRQRRLGAVAAAAVVIVTAATMVTEAEIGHRSGSGASDLGGDAMVSAHPPVAEPVVLPLAVPGWTTRAWMAGNGVHCDVSSLQGEPGALSSHCGSDNLDTTVSGGTTIGFPIASPAPAKDGYGTFVIWVRGPAAELKLTLDGATTSGRLTRVGTAGGQRVEVAVILVPLHGRHSWGSNDITELVAVDATGRQVASWLHPATKPVTSSRP